MSTAQVIDRILDFEGGIADVGDGVGVTRFGQTDAWLEKYGFARPKDRGEAAWNYEAWMVVERLDKVCAIDASVGFVVTNWAVHAGEKAAIRGLQTVLDVEPDGRIGPITLRALRDTEPHWRVAMFVLAAQARHYGSLLGSPSTDRRKWARGWLNRLATVLEQVADEAA